MRPAGRAIVAAQARVHIDDGRDQAAHLFKIDFNHPVFRSHQSFATVDFSTTSYLKEIARARTFGFMRDMPSLVRKGVFYIAAVGAVAVQPLVAVQARAEVQRARRKECSTRS